MTNEYRLSFTANEIDEKLEKIDINEENISKLSDEIANLGKPTDEQVTSAVNDYIEANGISVGGLEWGVVSNGEVFELSTEEEPAKPVECKGITLDKTSITISDLESSETLIATVEPFDTTEQVIWSIDNEEVATLENGVITPIANGNAVVTVTCGSYSATCEVKVNIIASYTKANLKAYYDLTRYEDGYAGEVEDLSGNGVVPILAGQSRYTTGRNGFVGGKFMLNKDNTESSTFTIPSNNAFTEYPFTVELYAHLRAPYSWYKSDGVVEFQTNVTGKPLGVASVFETTTGGTTGNGVSFKTYTNAVQLHATVSPALNATLDEPIIIDGVTDDTTITDNYYHFVACVDKNHQAIYLNGVKICEATNGFTNITGSDRDMTFFTSNLMADIKMVRVYNSFLTDEQVANNYSHTIGTYGGEA